MTLKKYVKNLKKYLKAHPQYAHLPVVTSRDDEGNDYNWVRFKAGHGTFEMYNGDELESVCVN